MARAPDPGECGSRRSASRGRAAAEPPEPVARPLGSICEDQRALTARTPSEHQRDPALADVVDGMGGELVVLRRAPVEERVELQRPLLPPGPDASSEPAAPTHHELDQRPAQVRLAAAWPLPKIRFQERSRR